jgi:predicted transposase YbfD/YdcC
MWKRDRDLENPLKYFAELKDARVERTREHLPEEILLIAIEVILSGEDLSRKRAGHAAQNYSILTRIALNMLKQDKTCKLGVHGKRLQTALDHEYLLRLLGVQI